MVILVVMMRVVRVVLLYHRVLGFNGVYYGVSYGGVIAYCITRF